MISLDGNVNKNFLFVTLVLSTLPFLYCTRITPEKLKLMTFTFAQQNHGNGKLLINTILTISKLILFFFCRKDRPTSPSELTNGSSEYSHTTTKRSVSSTPTSGFRDDFQHSPQSPSYNGSSSPTVYFGTSRRSSVNSNESPHEVSPANVKFVRDTSKFWYKATISREQGEHRTISKFIGSEINQYIYSQTRHVPHKTITHSAGI